MELTFDDNKMQFYPQVNHVRDLLISVVEKIAVSLPSVSLKLFKITLKYLFLFISIYVKKDTNSERLSK